MDKNRRELFERFEISPYLIYLAIFQQKKKHT